MRKPLTDQLPQAVPFECDDPALRVAHLPHIPTCIEQVCGGLLPIVHFLDRSACLVADDRMGLTSRIRDAREAAFGVLMILSVSSVTLEALLHQTLTEVLELGAHPAWILITRQPV